MTLQQLIEKASAEQLSEKERADMRQLIAGDSAWHVIDRISDAILATKDVQSMEKQIADSMLSVILSVEEQTVPGRVVHRVHFLKSAWLRYAAAVILIITGVMLYYNLSHTSQSNTEVAQTISPSISNDVLPGFNHAVLTLSDGNKIELDSAASETIKDGTLSIENSNGQLIYKTNGVAAMNTMTTPKGGQYRLTLPDGTRVWLNATSSITYPTAFTGKMRKVTVTGEVYFEVSKNKEKPFVVQYSTDEIIVLGTAFNVNAYPDEPAAKISLVEGSIKVRNKTLHPGQAFSAGNIISTNIDQDIAWKNGAFDFNGLDFAAGMRQLERWYDIQVVYDSRIPQEIFYGKMDRNLRLQEVLELLDGIAAKFHMEGKTLHVSQ